MAIIEAEKLNLKYNHLNFSLLGNLYTDIDNMKAIKNFEIALNLAMTNADKSTITKNLYDLKAKKNNS
ncbi:hypothetical protein [Parasediminibacterium sp. JCM 36343]|uniref:hypothetical protein n=1 Tax=Parasediminibacterium sp. JCM 36343 TaxID=3374279 RepID=UPI00397E6C72